MVGGCSPESGAAAFDISGYVKFPLYADEFCEYVWDAADGMLFETYVKEPGNNKKVTDILNGTSLLRLPSVTYDHRRIYCSNMPLLEVRATAILMCRCELDETETEAVRRMIVRWAAERLSDPGGPLLRTS